MLILFEDLSQSLQVLYRYIYIKTLSDRKGLNLHQFILHIAQSDLGILASTDPVALDKACADMVIQAPILHTGNRLSAGHEHDDLCGHDKFHMMHPDTDWLAGLRHAEKIGLGNIQK